MHVIEPTPSRSHDMPHNDEGIAHNSQDIPHGVRITSHPAHNTSHDSQEASHDTLGTSQHIQGTSHNIQTPLRGSTSSQPISHQQLTTNYQLPSLKHIPHSPSPIPYAPSHYLPSSISTIALAISHSTWTSADSEPTATLTNIQLY